MCELKMKHKLLNTKTFEERDGFTVGTGCLEMVLAIMQSMKKKNKDVDCGVFFNTRTF